MNYYNLFYWVTAFDRISNLFGIGLAWSIILFVVFMFCLIITLYNRYDSCNGDINDSDYPKYTIWVKSFRRFMYVTGSLILFFSLLITFVPTKKDAMIIIIGGAVGNYLKSDTTAQKIPADAFNVLHMYLKDEAASLGNDMIKEAGLTIESPKDKLIEKLNGLTSKDEIINALKSDSTLKIDK